MAILNKSQVDTLFQREAVMIGTADVVPVFRAASLFGEGAVEHARNLKHWNSYGVGDFDLDYITYRGFQVAASFYNVQQLRDEA